MNRLEHRLRSSRPAPVSLPSHRAELRASIRLQGAARLQAEENWPFLRYAAVMGASLVLLGGICGWTLLAPLPERAYDPALRALIARFESLPSPPGGLRRMDRRLSAGAPEPLRPENGPRAPDWQEQRRLLNQLLTTGM